MTNLMTPNLLTLSWEDVENGVRVLEDAVRGNPGPQPTAVLGISRGGLVPGVMLSHALGIPFKAIGPDAFSWTDYPNHHPLIVDEVYDSGKTLGCIHQLYPNALYAVLVMKQPTTHTFGGKMFWAIPGALYQWVTFPWEVARG